MSKDTTMIDRSTLPIAGDRLGERPIERLAIANGNYYFRGYLEIARRFLFTPVFEPVHPKW